MEIEKASLSEEEVSCDICGRVDKRKKFVSIYFGDKGQKVDIYSKCLREGSVNAERK